MKHVVRLEPRVHCGPDLRSAALIALCTLILCSCRAPSGQMAQTKQGPAGWAETAGSPQSGTYGTLPPSAYTGVPAAAMATMPMGPPGMEQGVPMPYTPRGPWSPDGLHQPWPEDEYIRDGGDEGRPTGVSRDWEIRGLEMEDTVAHYDTLDGRTVVEPTNEVFIYSPRFGAVRQVVGLVSNDERQKASGIYVPVKLDTPSITRLVGNAKQNISPDDKVGARPPLAMRTKQGRDVLSNAVGLRAFQNSFKAYENLAIIRQGMAEGTEMAFLAQGSNAAIAWSHTQSVQVILDRKNAMVDVKYDKTSSVYMLSEPPGHPKLRVVKVASTPFAEPGDEVDFTIRFDNVGDETIGTVTIVDSLNTRLEFVPDSAQCSVDAQFFTEPNEGESVVVRCEVSKPLEAGKGGILRFRCRVR
jgi:uncharacterized repeat protein (TIGR01451 family)